jgi:TrmH RNA methyltransferase
MKRPRQPSRRPATPERPAARLAGRKPAAAAGDRPAPRHRGKAEEKYHGLRACEALFARRPQDIIRVYIDEGRRRQFTPLLDHCARSRLGFQVVAAENLARLSGSTHHEGIVILARELQRWSSADLLHAVAVNRLKGPLLYLDGVQNPHNLGAMLRTAAHFGAAAVLGHAGELPPLSPAAVRVAEGAAEYVPVCGLTEPKADLARLKECGFRVVTTSSHRGRDVSPESLGGRIVLVLGGEGEGVSKPIAALADEAVRIPGTGVVESLNVSVACGILLAAAWDAGGTE